MKYLKHIIYSVLAVFLVACGPTTKTTTPSMPAKEKVVDFRATAPTPGPAPEIKLGKTNTFKLDNGLTVIVVENHKLPTVNMNLYLDYPTLYEGDKAGLTSFFGSVMKGGTKNYTKEQLDEELDFQGISLNVGSRGVGLNTLSSKLPKAVELMREVLFNPTFDNTNELEKVRKQSITGLEATTKNSDAIMGRVSGALNYGKNHPLGEYGTKESYESITMADLKKHYDTYFKPNMAYLTIVGDITLADAKKMVNDNFYAWLPGSVSKQQIATPKNPAQTEIVIVDLPTATQSNIQVSNLQDLKKSSGDYFGSILGNHILGTGSSSRLYKNLREDKAFTYGAYSSMGSSRRWPAQFKASTKVRNEVTDSAVVELMHELNMITSKPISTDEIKMAQTQRTGTFALGLERPETVGAFARNILMEELDENFYADYLKNQNAQTSASIMSALKANIKPNNARIIIVGKAADFADKVKALGYPVKFYDIWANEVADPTVKKDMGTATVSGVLDKFLAASGGLDKLNAIKSMVKTYEVDMPGMPSGSKMIFKTMAPNKMNMVMEVAGMGQVMKQVFNGESGYMEQMGQKMDMEASQIAEMKSANVILEPLGWIGDKTVKLDNIVDVNGKKAYKLVRGNAERYFDVATGLLLKAVDMTEMQGQKLTEVSEFSEYKMFNGIKLPTVNNLLSMGQSIKLVLKSVEMNKGVSDADFK